MKIRFLAFVAILAAFTLFSSGAFSADAKLKSVAAVYKEKTALAGQTISIQGKVVKVNNGIMGRNFLHLQDGTGDAASNDLVITSEQTAKVGDKVTITGVVVINRDFGSGYTFPLLIEKASVVAAK